MTLLLLLTFDPMSSSTLLLCSFHDFFSKYSISWDKYCTWDYFSRPILESPSAFQCWKILCNMLNFHHRMSCFLDHMTKRTSDVRGICDRKRCLWGLWKTTEEKLQCHFLEFWSKAMPSAMKNWTTFKI